MRTVLDPMEQYLLRLADNLEALGPGETTEILAEIRTHLAEALAEADGNESGVLASFGSPEALAHRILEERGVTSGGRVPEAPIWMRVAAHSIDVAVWLVVSLLLSSVAIFISALILAAFRIKDSSDLQRPVEFAILACFAASLGWFFWLRKRNSRGFLSTGMIVMGLRRVQVGPTRRAVRGREIVGLPKYRLSRAGAIWTALVVLVLLGSSVYNLSSSNDQSDKMRSEATLSRAVYEATSASGNVSDVYRMVMMGNSTTDIEGNYEFADPKILTDLEARRASGKLGSYAMGLVDLPKPDQLLDLDPQALAVDTVVRVYEYSSGSESPEEYYYHLKLEMHQTGDGSYAGRMVFESYERAPSTSG